MKNSNTQNFQTSSPYAFSFRDTIGNKMTINTEYFSARKTKDQRKVFQASVFDPNNLSQSLASIVHPYATQRPPSSAFKQSFSHPEIIPFDMAPSSNLDTIDAEVDFDESIWLDTDDQTVERQLLLTMKNISDA